MAVRWKCPICKKATEPLAAQFPFCSDRCRTQDLANWSTEKYVISTPVYPGETDELDELIVSKAPGQPEDPGGEAGT